MSIRVEYVVGGIKSCTTFEQLMYHVRDVVDRNMVEHVAPELLERVQTLDISTTTDDFLKIMIWGVCYSNYSDTMLNILKEYCKRAEEAILKDLPEEKVTPLLITTVYILSENSQGFRKSLTSGAYNDSSLVDKLHKGLDYHGIEIIWDGHEEMEQYDFDRNSVLPMLETICNSFFTDKMDEEIAEESERLSYLKGMNLTADQIRFFMKGILSTMKQCADELNEIGANNQDNVVLYPVGKFIIELCKETNYFVGAISDSDNITVSNENISRIYGSCMNIFDKYYENDVSQILISHVIHHFNVLGNGRDSWFSGDYLKAVKLYLDKDPAFQMFFEDHANTVTKTIVDDEQAAGYTTMIYHYLDPSLEANESYFQIIATEASKKSEQWNYEDDDNSEEDGENQDRDYDIEASQSTKGYDKRSKKQEDTQNKIYKAYKNYKNNEQKVDSQLNKMLQSAKRAFTGDKTEEILSGQKWTPIKLLKRVLKTAAIFSISKVGAFIYLVTSHTLDKRRTERQRREIIAELNTEIDLLQEKIDDARGDGNRQAKYALMRTKAELERARDRIRYSLTASRDDMQRAKDVIMGKRGRRTTRYDRGEY